MDSINYNDNMQIKQSKTLEIPLGETDGTIVLSMSDDEQAVTLQLTADGYAKVEAKKLQEILERFSQDLAKFIRNKYKV